MLSLIMPCFNEGARIFQNLLETDSTLNSLDFEIIAVDDGSTDSTKEQIRKAQNICNRIRLVNSSVNHGKGGAILEGFKQSNGDILVLLDSDLEIHPRHILEFLGIMNAADADIVVASNRHPASKVEYPLYRIVLSRIYHTIVRVFLVPLRHQAGLKIYKRKVFEEISPLLVTSRYAAEIEQLALPYELGYKIVEAPVTIRFKGRGGMRLSNIIHTGIETALIWFRLKVVKAYNLDGVRRKH